jgi:menaquinone-specific isochorismate synthase
MASLLHYPALRRMPLPSEGFLLEYAPGRLLLGEGPLRRQPAAASDRPSCFAPDFYLRDPTPWVSATRVTEISLDGLRAMLPAVAPPRVRWTEPNAALYERAFGRVADEIAAGRMTKAVPVLFEHGTLTDGTDRLVPSLLSGVLATGAPSLAYGIWTATDGMIGATPEILFDRRDARTVHTVAVAGTYPVERADALAEDPKERHEHQSVVDDITAALGPLGRVTVGERTVLPLPRMAHLKTEMSLALSRDVSFAELVRVLHPTAALGVAPHAAGLDLLRQLDGPVDRARFGAPFGVAWPDGSGVALVAIRNVQWRGTALTLGAGAGLIAESRLDREWDELRLKRTAVKQMLGL